MLIKNSVENSTKFDSFSSFRLGVWHCVDFYNAQDVLDLIDIFFSFIENKFIMCYWYFDIIYNLFQMKLDERFLSTRIHHFRFSKYPVRNKKKGR